MQGACINNMENNKFYKVFLCIMLLVFMYVSAACSISNDDKDSKEDYYDSLVSVNSDNYIVKNVKEKESVETSSKIKTNKDTSVKER